MIAVIFEVWPAEDGRAEYLDIAARLRPELERIDGFLSVERFQSLTEPAKMLSLSFWRDEDAVKAWRSKAEHRIAQARARRAVPRLPPAGRRGAARLRPGRAGGGAGRPALIPWRRGTLGVGPL